MEKPKIQAIGKDGVIKGEKIILNATGSEQYVIAEYNDNNEKDNLNNDNIDILLKPIYFENIADTITAKLFKTIIENEGYCLLSCNINEYKNDYYMKEHLVDSKLFKEPIDESPVPLTAN